MIPPPATLRRVLVRGPNWVGDAVLATPVLTNLRQALPQGEMTLLVRPSVAGLFRGHPAVDSVLLDEVEGRHRGVGGRLRLARDLARARFDLALLLPNSFDVAAVAFLARIPHRVGYATDGRGFLLTFPVPRPPRGTPRHQADAYLDLLRPLGWDAGARDLSLPLTAAAEERVQTLLQEAGITREAAVVALTPGSVYGSAKRWPAERFAEVADRLISRYGVAVVIVGSAGERDVAAAVTATARFPLLDLTGRTTLEELVALVARCRLLVTNDTGAMHIAAALGTPVVALFGPTDPATTGPQGGSSVILRDPPACAPCLLRECPIDHRCMTALSGDRVLTATARFLHAPPASSPRSSPVVFLDRDGTLVEEVNYLRRPDQIRLLPRTAEALSLLGRAGFARIVVTNQSGIARGYFTEADMEAVHARLRALLTAEQSGLTAIYFCPHHPEEGRAPYRQDCSCRKPKGGMVERAVREHSLDLSRSYVVGDRGEDMALARTVGARAVLVLTGYGKEEWAHCQRGGGVRPEHVAADLYEAAEWIIQDSRREAWVTSHT